MKSFSELREESKKVDEISEGKNPTTIKHGDAVKALKILGYEIHRQAPNHLIFKHAKTNKTFSLPGQHSKDISPALTRQIFALSEDESVDESSKQELKSYMLPVKPEEEGVDFKKIKHHNKFVRNTLNKLRKIRKNV